MDLEWRANQRLGPDVVFETFMCPVAMGKGRRPWISHFKTLKQIPPTLRFPLYVEYYSQRRL